MKYGERYQPLSFIVEFFFLINGRFFDRNFFFFTSYERVSAHRDFCPFIRYFLCFFSSLDDVDAISTSEEQVNEVNATFDIYSGPALGLVLLSHISKLGGWKCQKRGRENDDIVPFEFPDPG